MDTAEDEHVVAPTAETLQPVDSARERELTGADVEPGGALSPIEELSEPTTEADEDFIDAFLGLGISVPEMQQELQRTRKCLEAAEKYENEYMGISRLELDSYHSDLLETLRCEEEYVEPQALDEVFHSSAWPELELEELPELEDEEQSEQSELEHADLGFLAILGNVSMVCLTIPLQAKS